ncbi:hypothetical protein ACL1E5_11110, partial [Corynebacterium striatum]
TGETRLRFWALAGQPPAVVPTNRKQAVPRSRNRGTNYPRSAPLADANEEGSFSIPLIQGENGQTLAAKMRGIEPEINSEVYGSDS